MCEMLIVITYFYLEFLNSCSTNPTNIGVQYRWGLVDHLIVLCVNFKKMYLSYYACEKSFFTIAPRNSGALTNPRT